MLIDRGSREREAEEELEIICEKVREKGNYDFTEFCFLEVVPPFIEDGMEKCLKKNSGSDDNCTIFSLSWKKSKDSGSRCNEVPKRYQNQVSCLKTNDYA